MVEELFTPAQLQMARDLVEQNGLSFEEGCDELVGIHDKGRLVAVGGRAGDILKMFAIEPLHQGGSLLGELVTELVRRGFSAGYNSLFVFTRPEHTTTFAALNFALLASQGNVALIEYGRGLERWLVSHRALVRPGNNGAVVMNCNPFTLGHRFLVERAASQVDTLYLFVVTEDRSRFPFPVRMRLVREGVADLENVLVLDTSRYAISNATFPTYFLKKSAPRSRIQMELDLTLFCSRIAPYFNITRRFAGSEPCCELTGAYNETMKQMLPQFGMTLVEIERLTTDAGIISASRARHALADGDRATLVKLLPASTLAFLDSDEAAPILARVRNDDKM